MKMSSCKSGFERLPKFYIPKVYTLELFPNAKESTFQGLVTISLSLSECTKQIILNAKKLEVISAKVKTPHFELAASEKAIVYDDVQEKLTITFDATISKGEIDLTLKYKGILADDMHGFYRSTTKNEDGKESIILSTQFESTFARRAFPCFDEPAKKAIFRISIVVPDHLTVLSCMPEVSRKPVKESELNDFGLPSTAGSHSFVKVSFDDTPKMSTYIVAFVIGHFDYIEAMDANNVRIRVYTPPKRTHLGAHALKMAKTAIPFFTEVFGAEYPLPKLDLVAIPDFAMGAMENWGLLTYRETCLLIDEEQSSLSSKRQVALTVAHECAHMWFGNLVTMEWWTHLWLNEGFATWISYLAVDHCFPDYDIWTDFLSMEFYSAMATDELKTSHPIEVEVCSPAEIDEIFDAVSYEKGASIIRMINDYMTPEKFRKGLQLYIQRHEFGNTKTNDLWNALSEVIGEDMQKIMSTWTKQMGFPLLTVRKINETGSTVTYTIDQERFLADGSPDVNDQSEWCVPVTICDASDSSKILKRFLLPREARRVPYELEFPVGTKFRLNPGATAFYRVRYEESLIGPVLEALEEKKLDNKDRLSILADEFALARAGFKKMSLAMTMASTFHGENDYTVWCKLRSQLVNLRSLLEEQSFSAMKDPAFEGVDFNVAMNAFITHLAQTSYKNLGWEPRANESNNDALLRPLIVSLLGGCGFIDAVSEAKECFDRHYNAIMSGGDSNSKDLIHPDIRVSVYSTCMRHGDEKTLDCLLKLHSKATMHDERVRILRSIGSTRAESLVKRVIELTFSDLVRKQDRLSPLIVLSYSSAVGRRAVWAEIKKRVETLADDLGTVYLMGRVINCCCEGFCTKEDYEEINAFFKQHPVSCARAVQQALESIKVNMGILERDAECLGLFLVEFMGHANGSHA
nr:puromycin sensitive aminopeptidase [Hymenolepis microstoma]